MPVLPVGPRSELPFMYKHCKIHIWRVKKYEAGYKAKIRFCCLAKSALDVVLGSGQRTGDGKREKTKAATRAVSQPVSVALAESIFLNTDEITAPAVPPPAKSGAA